MPVHNVIAAIAAAPQPDTAPRAGGTASDTGSFRDVLSAKVVGQSQERAAASGTKDEVADSRGQPNAKAGAKSDNSELRLTKVRDPRDLDRGDSLNAAPASTTPPPQLLLAAGTAEAAATMENSEVLNQAGLPFSDIVGVVTGSASSAAPTGPSAQLKPAAPPAYPGGVVNSDASSSTAMAHPQVADPSQSQTSAATEEDTATSADGESAPSSLTSTDTSEPNPSLFAGVAATGSGQSPLDALGDGTGVREKTSESDPSALPAFSSTGGTGRRNLPLQAPADSGSASPENPPGTVTAIAAVPASQAETAAKVFPEINAPPDASTPQSLRPNRKVDSGQSRGTGRKEDRDPSQSSQPETSPQPESQTAPLKAGEATTRAVEVSAATAGMGHNANPDGTAANAASGELVGLQASHPSPDNPLAPGVKGQSTPLSPTSNAGDTPPAATVLQSARVLERMGQSEIRVGLNTADFGNLELHTSVSQDRVAATLATSHGELRAALAAEMPSLEHAMSQHQLTLDRFHLDTRSGAQDGNRSASGNQQNRSQTWTQPAAEPGVASDVLPAPETASSQVWLSPYSSGLNVHA